MIRCIRCASDAPEGAKFCLECGSALADPLAQTSIIEEDESLVLLRALQRSLSGEFDVECEVGRGATFTAPSCTRRAWPTGHRASG